MLTKEEVDEDVTRKLVEAQKVEAVRVLLSVDDKLGTRRYCRPQIRRLLPFSLSHIVSILRGCVQRRPALMRQTP